MVGCSTSVKSATTGHVGSPHAHPSYAPPEDLVEDPLHAIAFVHGGTGPWAVAGYRMGRHALQRLALPRQSFDLEVIHQSPRAVQFTCIMDGAAVATGASPGKMNLSYAEATATQLQTVYRSKRTGQTLTLRPTAAFIAQFQNIPPEQLALAGHTVLTLPEAEVFEEVKK